MEDKFPILERETWKVQRQCASDPCNNLREEHFKKRKPPGRDREVSAR